MINLECILYCYPSLTFRDIILTISVGVHILGVFVSISIWVYLNGRQTSLTRQVQNKQIINDSIKELHEASDKLFELVQDKESRKNNYNQRVVQAALIGAIVDDLMQSNYFPSALESEVEALKVELRQCSTDDEKIYKTNKAFETACNQLTRVRLAIQKVFRKSYVV